jgi:hypothetical protein
MNHNQGLIIPIERINNRIICNRKKHKLIQDNKEILPIVPFSALKIRFALNKIFSNGDKPKPAIKKIDSKKLP